MIRNPINLYINFLNHIVHNFIPSLIFDPNSWKQFKKIEKPMTQSQPEKYTPKALGSAASLYRYIYWITGVLIAPQREREKYLQVYMIQAFGSSRAYTYIIIRTLLLLTHMCILYRTAGASRRFLARVPFICLTRTSLSSSSSSS